MADCKEKPRCEAKGCTRPAKCRGHCAAHHARAKRGASVDVAIKPRQGGPRGRRGPLAKLGTEVPVGCVEALRRESRRRDVSIAVILTEVLEAWRKDVEAEAWEAEAVSELRVARAKSQASHEAFRASVMAWAEEAA